MISVSIVFAALLVVGLHPRLKRDRDAVVISATVIVLVTLIGLSDLSRIGIFIKHVCLFHLGEWTFVWLLHRDSVTFDSFLINNSTAYVG